MASSRRKALLARQRRGQRRALAHQHQRVQRVGAHGAVVQGFGGGLQRAQDRHARAGQHGQRAGKAGRVVAARQPPTSGRRSQAASMRRRRPRRCSAGASAQPRRQASSAQRPASPTAHEVADGQHDHGQQSAGRACCRRTRWPPAAPRSHQEHHDDDGHQRDDGRVERGADQLVASASRSSRSSARRSSTVPRWPLCSPAPPRRCSSARTRAGTGQRLGEGAAGVDLGAQAATRLRWVVLGLVGQRRQRALQRQARATRPASWRVQTASAVALNTRPPHSVTFQPWNCLPGLRAAGRRVPPPAAPAPARAAGCARPGGVGLDQALVGGALGVQGFEGVGGHGDAVSAPGARRLRARSCRRLCSHSAAPSSLALRPAPVDLGADRVRRASACSRPDLRRCRPMVTSSSKMPVRPW
jgi:hypothetical protein